MAGHIVLPWIHRVFSLMKRWGLGTYHGLRRKHVDTYLNEFVFRSQRFRIPLQPPLLSACLSACLIRDHTRARLPPSADELLGDHRPRQSPQGGCHRSASASASQDSHRHPAGHLKPLPKLSHQPGFAFAGSSTLDFDEPGTTGQAITRLTNLYTQRGIRQKRVRNMLTWVPV
jgi:hypothetical protein